MAGWLGGDIVSALLQNRVAFGAGMVLVSFIVAQAIAVALLQCRRRRIAQKQTQLAVAAGNAAVPVTIVTGFLGAGKTQLLNRLLANPPKNERGQALRIVVIENEVGAVSIDHALLKRGSEGNPSAGVYVLANGCMCCSAPGEGDELERTLDRLLGINASHPDAFDYVIIETSGLADPAPIVETFFRMDTHGRFFIDGVVTVVDAKHIAYHLDGAGMLSRVNEAGRQVALADIVLLNKVDLATAGELLAAAEAIQHMNPTAQLYNCAFADVPVAAVLNQRAFSSAAVLHQLVAAREGHSHDTRVKAVTITDPALERAGVPFEQVWSWIDDLVAHSHERVYRIKALLRVVAAGDADPRWFVIHGVHGIVRGAYVDDPIDDAAECEHGGCDAGDHEHSHTAAAVVIIGRDLDEAQLRASFHERVLRVVDVDTVVHSMDTPPSAAVHRRIGRRRGSGMG